MATIGDYCVFLLISAGGWIARQLSPKSADAFGVGIGNAAWLLWRSRRHIALENLRGSFGATKSEAELQIIAKSVFQNIGRTMVEVSRFELLGLAGAKEIIQLDVPLIMDTVHAEGKGAIFVTAHFGNWELLSAVPKAFRNYEMDVIVAEQHNQFTNKLLLEYRRVLGTTPIPSGKAVSQVIRALRKNHFVAIAADQHAPASGALRLPFLGREAAFAKGPALFAIRAQCPVVPVLLHRKRYDRHEVIIGEPIYPDLAVSEDENILHITSAYSTFLEKNITKYPDQWMWTHRRWKL